MSLRDRFTARSSTSTKDEEPPAFEWPDELPPEWADAGAAVASDGRPWLLRRLPLRHARLAAVGAIAAMAVASAVLITGARVARQDAGHVGVVRNGGPIDDRAIRQVLLPGQKVTWTGMFSQAPHEYPAAKVVLFYTITADARRGERREVDVVSVPTRDGVLVGLEGTVFFKFVGERDVALLKRFDQTFGTRKFPVAGGNATVYPWDGEEGFGAALDATFRPILDNDLRTEIGRFACAELLASCTMVRRVVEPAKTAGNTNMNITAVEARLNESLRGDLRRTLGGDYFRDIHVRIARVTLPGGVQAAVDKVQAQYVEVSGAKADVRRASYEAKRNAMLAKSYNNSPALARIHEIQSAPKGSTIVLPAQGPDSPGINVGG